MAEDWGMDPEAIEETTSELKISRWLALNVARADFAKKKTKRLTDKSSSPTKHEPGTVVRKVF
ncbi:MAG: hypothetical protein Q7N50_01855 [Armatimonadota bacterium]|nr:hypothetical protein [Armatimonadota bacterium]